MKDSIMMSHPYHRNTRSKHDHDTFQSEILKIAFESLIRALIPTYSFGSPIRVGQNAAAPFIVILSVERRIAHAGTEILRSTLRMTMKGQFVSP